MVVFNNLEFEKRGLKNLFIKILEQDTPLSKFWYPLLHSMHTVVDEYRLQSVIPEQSIAKINIHIYQYRDLYICTCIFLAYCIFAQLISSISYI